MRSVVVAAAEARDLIERFQIVKNTISIRSITDHHRTDGLDQFVRSMRICSPDRCQIHIKLWVFGLVCVAIVVDAKYSRFHK
jgi:hypothetical protein